jgi:hypothetical protein
MRKPLRHALNALAAAGVRVTDIHQGGRHTEIHLENGECIRLHRGNRVSPAFERGLRESIRKWGAS